MAAPPVPQNITPEYRVKGRGHVFTWSQCAQTQEEGRAFLFRALDTLERVLALKDGRDKVSGGVEAHESGTFHVHIGVVRADGKAVKVGRRLDVDGVHPNCSPHAFTTSSLRACLSYPLKEDEEGWMNFQEEIEDLFDPLPGHSAASASRDKDSAWKEAMDAASYEDAMEIIKQSEPREFVINHDKIKAFFQNYFAPTFEVQFRADQFNRAPINWDDIPLRNTVVITGPPRLGKTQYAAAQLGDKPLFCSDMDILRQFNPSIHTGILFDEVSTKMWPGSSFINLLDREMPRAIRVRYAIVTIPVGTKKIICVNNVDDIIPQAASGDQLDAIHDRMTVIHVQDRLY